jgi:RNA polymerase sigma factor (sigma-70 family)
MGPSEYWLRNADLGELVAAAQSSEYDDTPAMNEVVRRFEPLAQRLSRVFTECPYLRDDLANAARLAVVPAVRNHDGRPGFAGYAAQFMRGAVIREYRLWASPAGEVLVEGATEPAESREVIDIQAELERRLAPWGDGLVAAALDGLASDQRSIAELRYVHDATMEVIAETTQTTSSAVSQRLSTIHRRVAAMLAA